MNDTKNFNYLESNYLQVSEKYICKLLILLDIDTPATFFYYLI